MTTLAERRSTWRTHVIEAFGGRRISTQEYRDAHGSGGGVCLQTRSLQIVVNNMSGYLDRPLTVKVVSRSRGKKMTRVIPAVWYDKARGTSASNVELKRGSLWRLVLNHNPAYFDLGTVKVAAVMSTRVLLVPSCHGTT